MTIPGVSPKIARRAKSYGIFSRIRKYRFAVSGKIVEASVPEIFYIKIKNGTFNLNKKVSITFGGKKIDVPIDVDKFVYEYFPDNQQIIDSIYQLWCPDSLQELIVDKN